MSHIGIYRKYNEVEVCLLKQYWYEQSKSCFGTVDGRYRAFVSASGGFLSEEERVRDTSHISIEVAALPSRSKQELKKLLSSPVRMRSLQGTAVWCASCAGQEPTQGHIDRATVSILYEPESSLEWFVVKVFGYSYALHHPDSVNWYYETCSTFDTFLANVYAFGSGDDFLFRPMRNFWPEGDRPLRRLINRWRRGQAQTR